MRTIYDIFKHNEIKIPFPQRDVYIKENWQPTE
jgi:small-conductance mechanosensitive channel